MQPGNVGTSRTFRYVDQELIVRTSQLNAVSAHFGFPPAAPTEQLGGLTRIRSSVLAGVFDRLGELAPDQARAVAPNYVLQPWVSSGGAGWPEPSTAPALIAPAAPAVPVAVFDSGLISGYADNHPQLARAKPGTGPADEVPPRNGGTMRLFDCHGTFVAGVLGCAAPAADIRVLRAFDDGGGTDDWSLAVAIDEFLTANPDVRLVNLSCGTFASPLHPPLALYEVVTRHPRVLFVAAAGNLPDPSAGHHSSRHTTADAEAAGRANGVRKHIRTGRLGGSNWEATDPDAQPATQPTVQVLPAYPAAFDAVIGVGSASPDGTPAAWTDLASTDVFAAGTEVTNAFGTGWVSDPLGSAPVGPFAGRAVWRGTSFAAPLAAGLLTVFAAEFEGVPPGFALIANAAMAWLRDRYGDPADPAAPILLPYPA